MNYETFRDTLMAELRDYLPQCYNTRTLCLCEVPKVNGYMEGISLVSHGEHSESPTIYVKDLFDYYQQCEDIEKVCQRAASVFVMGMDYLAQLDKPDFQELPKENVIYCLINAEENQRLLEHAPHRMTMDLALIYRILLNTEEDGINTTIITNELAEYMGLSEEELYALAEENTPRLLPPELHHYHEYFVILTNKCKLMGATTLLYPGLLNAVADQMESDLFILPASVHEVILLPAVDQDIAEMNRGIVEANNTIIGPEEVLSHHVYYYHRDDDLVAIPVEK